MLVFDDTHCAETVDGYFLEKRHVGLLGFDGLEGELVLGGDILGGDGHGESLPAGRDFGDLFH